MQQSSQMRFRAGTERAPGLLILGLAIALSHAPAFPQLSSAQPVKPDDGQTVNDFEARVSRYVAERRKHAGGSPRSTSSPEKLEEGHQALAQKAQLARTGAQRGDVFTPEATAYFRGQIAAALAGPEGPKIRASLKHAEPVRDDALRVNQVYPHGLPLQSTPPSLLQRLPPLPKELQYRIVGRNLVLLDVAPKLVVDFIPAAISLDKD